MLKEIVAQLTYLRYLDRGHNTFLIIVSFNFLELTLERCDWHHFGISDPKVRGSFPAGAMFMRSSFGRTASAKRPSSSPVPQL